MNFSDKIVQFLIATVITFVGAYVFSFSETSFLYALVIIPASLIYVAIKDEGAKTRKKINDLMSLLEEKKKTE